MSDEKPTTPADETQRDIATAIACIAVHQDGTPRFEETVANIRTALAAARAEGLAARGAPEAWRAVVREVVDSYAASNRVLPDAPDYLETALRFDEAMLRARAILAADARPVEEADPVRAFLAHDRFCALTRDEHSPQWSAGWTGNADCWAFGDTPEAACAAALAALRAHESDE